MSSSSSALCQPMTRALDEPAGLVGPLAGGLASRQALAGALVLDVDDGQPEQLGDGVVAGEVAAALVTLRSW
jgi:hypothetical protein